MCILGITSSVSLARIVGDRLPLNTPDDPCDLWFPYTSHLSYHRSARMGSTMFECFYSSSQLLRPSSDFSANLRKRWLFFNGNESPTILVTAMIEAIPKCTSSDPHAQVSRRVYGRSADKQVPISYEIDFRSGLKWMTSLDHRHIIHIRNNDHWTTGTLHCKLWVNIPSKNRKVFFLLLEPFKN